MPKTITSLLLVCLFVFAGALVAPTATEARSYRSGGSYYMQSGYYKPSSGTYVMPHLKTRPDSTKWNNKGCIESGRCY